MNIKKGFLFGALTIIFIIVFAEIFGEDPVTFFKYSSITVRVIMILVALLFIFIIAKKEYK